MTCRIKQQDDVLTRFDKLQRQVTEAKQNAKSAAHDLCRAVIKSNGTLAFAIQGQKHEPAKRG